MNGTELFQAKAEGWNLNVYFAVERVSAVGTFPSSLNSFGDLVVTHNTCLLKIEIILQYVLSLSLTLSLSLSHFFFQSGSEFEIPRRRGEVDL